MAHRFSNMWEGCAWGDIRKREKQIAVSMTRTVAIYFEPVYTVAALAVGPVLPSRSREIYEEEASAVNILFAPSLVAPSSRDPYVFIPPKFPSKLRVPRDREQSNAMGSFVTRYSVDTAIDAIAP